MANTFVLVRRKIRVSDLHQRIPHIKQSTGLLIKFRCSLCGTESSWRLQGHCMLQLDWDGHCRGRRAATWGIRRHLVQPTDCKCEGRDYTPNMYSISKNHNNYCPQSGCRQHHSVPSLQRIRQRSQVRICWCWPVEWQCMVCACACYQFKWRQLH